MAYRTWMADILPLRFDRRARFAVCLTRGAEQHEPGSERLEQMEVVDCFPFFSVIVLGELAVGFLGHGAMPPLRAARPAAPPQSCSQNPRHLCPRYQTRCRDR